MTETLDYLRMLALFPVSLRPFLRQSLTLEQAKKIIRDRMAHRGDNFLRLAERSIFDNPRSPYLPLFKLAGCELGDLRTLVTQNGLDMALQELRNAEVYVTFEEFKGRRPIRRRGQEFSVSGNDFDNPAAKRDFVFQTSGSTGAAMKVAADLDHIVARAPQRMVTLAAHHLLDVPTAVWHGILPAGGGLRLMLYGAYTGKIPLKWFSHIGGRESREWLKYGAATYYLILCMRLAGLPIPFPEHVRVDRALVIAQWATEMVKLHGRCLIRTGVSRGVRLCLAAQAAGLDLNGVTITGGGEPPTPAKVSQMNKAGVRYIPNYGMSDAGQPGSGCARPVDGSDVHLFKDSIALFTHPYQVENLDVTVPAFNITTLLPNSPKVLLNVQTDDYGIVEERNCGCELESYGYTTHLRQIRSYSKLTSESATLVGTDMLHILEDVLPAHFGGSPLDYQLMEAEDEQGLTKLFLIISPRVAIPDEQIVIQAVLDALRHTSAMADAARLFWQHADILKIKRMEPVWTAAGKLLPLHIPHRYNDQT